jgi:hypothetical protein
MYCLPNLTPGGDYVMSFSIKAMPAHAIIVATLHHNFDPGRDTAAYVQDLRTQLDHMPRPAVFITIIDEVEIGLPDVEGLLGSLIQGEMAVLGHPNLKSMIVVTTNETVAFGAKLPRQGEVGKLPVMVARTLADAVAQAT